MVLCQEGGKLNYQPRQQKNQESDIIEVSHNYKIIENDKQMKQFSIENSNIQWIAFDTEYTTEKSYKPRLCLIQILTERGKYIIDIIKCKNITLFNKLLINPNILKITHSGGHDYKILNDEYNIIPKNVFDTQIACSFLYYQSRINLSDLILSLLNKKIEKGLAASDWEERPLTNEQLKYALNDAIFLKELKDILVQKLNDKNRLSWAQEEFKTLEYPNFYKENLMDDILDMHITNSLSKDEKIFLIKIMEWRKKEAIKKDMPETKILGFNFLKEFVTLLPLGEDYIRNNRKILPKVINEYLSPLKKLLNSPSENYTEIEKQIPPSGFDQPELEFLTKLSHLFIKHLCFKNNIGPELMCTEDELRFFLWNKTLKTSKLFKGWRLDFVGKELENILLSDNELMAKFYKMTKRFEASNNIENPKEIIEYSSEINELIALGFRKDMIKNIPNKWIKATTFLLNQLPENHVNRQIPTPQAGIWIHEKVRPILERVGVTFRKLPNHPWELIIDVK